MGVIWKAIKKLYRATVPVSLRKSRLVSTMRVSSVLPHDLVYDSEYYANRPAGTNSTRAIGDSILTDLSPATAVDIGCGTGDLLEYLRDNGGCVVFGLEYSTAAVTVCQERGLDVIRFNLERDALEKDRIFDVAISMEVAEHLPATAADRYVELLSRLSDWIVFTAAPPGQGGTDHVNEQPPSYWISKFRKRRFDVDAAITERWRERWKLEGVAGWYHKNLLVFNRCRYGIET